MTEQKEKLNIAICLATYNGAQFLNDFINCLSRQTNQNFFLAVRDDGSQDGTYQILQKVADSKKLDIIFIEDQKGNIGPARNFGEIINTVEADFYFLADQDDEWSDNKIEKFVERIVVTNPDTPTLLFSDLYLIDDESNHIDSIKINDNLKNVDFENHIPGCTMAFNRSLRDALILDATPNIMHDWWILLVLRKLNGKLLKIDEPLISYRQHSMNVVGWKSKKLNIFQRIFNLFYIRFKLFHELRSYNLLQSSRPLTYFVNFTLYKFGMRK